MSNGLTHENSRYLSGADLAYYWFVNGTNYGVTSAPSFTYSFKVASVSTVEATAVAHLNGTAPTKGDAARRAKDPSVAYADVKPSSKTAKSGSFAATLVARDPLEKFQVEGETWLRHGALLDLSVGCDGSGPWSYCWSIKDKDYNITGNETCVDPEELPGPACQFPVVWYFRSPGNFDILLQVN